MVAQVRGDAAQHDGHTGPGTALDQLGQMLSIVIFGQLQLRALEPNGQIAGQRFDQVAGLLPLARRPVANQLAEPPAPHVCQQRVQRG